MTRVGDKSWSPEMVFIFGTVFIIRYNKEKQLETLWTLQKDRAAANIWMPPGGEWEIPKRIRRKDLIQIADTGLREVKEEIGVEVRILGCGPFWECLIPNGYPNFHGQIITSHKIKGGECVSTYFKHGAHAMLLYYLGQITKGKPTCMEQPDEKNCEIVNFRWLTIDQSFTAFDNGVMKTYPSLSEALKRLRWMMIENKRKNPFALSYSDSCDK